MENRFVVKSGDKKDAEKDRKHEKKGEDIGLIRIVSPITLFGEKEDKITLSEKLVLACLDKKQEAALYFIENGADVNWASRTHTVIIPKPTFLTQWSDYHGYDLQVATPLLAAVVNGLDDVVRQLIQKGGDPNKLYKFKASRATADETLLHVAARKPNNAGTIRALLEGGAEPGALANYNDKGAIIATSISPEHSIYLLKEVACSCLLGCIVFSLCCSACRGKATKIPNVTPIQIARLSGFQENIEVLLSPAPQRLIMQ